MSCESYPNICIVQGQTYRQVFTADSDWSGAECRGQIRDNWLNSDGAIKAIFEFGALTYDAETDLTTVEGVISHQQTTALPATRYQGTGSQSVKNSLVYDVEFELDGNVFKLAPGYVQIIPEVSDDSVIYDPPVIWNGGIDNIELTETNGLIDTYTIWGDADKTINLGTFNVTNSEGVGIESANYDNSTGVLTFIYTDGTEFETTDIRGEKGDKGDSPVKGVDYFDGVDGYTPIKGVDYFDGSDADLDAATIKTRYESNDDTNAFTDAEKTKLAGITAGAEVNVSADWNAVSGDAQILNKPTLATVATTGAYSDLSGLPVLGTAAATDADDYATAAQGLLAEAALQPGDIDLSPYALSSDVNLALNNKVDKIAGKGLSTEDYTSTEKTKLGNLVLPETLTDKALYYYDSSSGLFKPLGIGTLGQTLIAQPANNPPYQWAAPSGGRELLTANRTYYVRTDGSDSNNGLTDTAGGAFLTIQKAIDVVASLDISIREVTIQVADGTYAGFIFKPLLGSGTCTISGNTGNTSLCIINSSISGSGVFGNWSLMGFRLTTVTGNCITCHNNFFLNISNIDFSTSGDRHLLITSGAIVRVGGNYSISGSPTGGSHILCEFGGKYICQGRTVTLTGTPAFSATFGFVFCHWSGLCDFVNSTFSGSATGRYYLVEKGGYIRGTVNGNLPGNVAGTVTSPGFYST